MMQERPSQQRAQRPRGIEPQLTSMEPRSVSNVLYKEGTQVYWQPVVPLERRLRSELGLDCRYPYSRRVQRNGPFGGKGGRTYIINEGITWRWNNSAAAAGLNESTNKLWMSTPRPSLPQWQQPPTVDGHQWQGMDASSRSFLRETSPVRSGVDAVSHHRKLSLLAPSEILENTEDQLYYGEETEIAASETVPTEQASRAATGLCELPAGSSGVTGSASIAQDSGTQTAYENAPLQAGRSFTGGSSSFIDCSDSAFKEGTYWSPHDTPFLGSTSYMHKHGPSTTGSMSNARQRNASEGALPLNEVNGGGSVTLVPNVEVRGITRGMLQGMWLGTTSSPVGFGGPISTPLQVTEGALGGNMLDHAASADERATTRQQSGACQASEIRVLPPGSTFVGVTASSQYSLVKGKPFECELQTPQMYSLRPNGNAVSSAAVPLIVPLPQTPSSVEPHVANRVWLDSHGNIHESKARMDAQQRPDVEVVMSGVGQFCIDPCKEDIYFVREIHFWLSSDLFGRPDDEVLRCIDNIGLNPLKNCLPLTNPKSGRKFDVCGLDDVFRAVWVDPNAALAAVKEATLGLSSGTIAPSRAFIYRRDDCSAGSVARNNRLFARLGAEQRLAVSQDGRRYYLLQKHQVSPGQSPSRTDPRSFSFASVTLPSSVASYQPSASRSYSIDRCFSESTVWASSAYSGAAHICAQGSQIYDPKNNEWFRLLISDENREGGLSSAQGRLLAQNLLTGEVMIAVEVVSDYTASEIMVKMDSALEGAFDRNLIVAESRIRRCNDMTEAVVRAGDPYVIDPETLFCIERVTGRAYLANRVIPRDAGATFFTISDYAAARELAEGRRRSVRMVPLREQRKLQRSLTVMSDAEQEGADAPYLYLVHPPTSQLAQPRAVSVI